MAKIKVSATAFEAIESDLETSRRGWETNQKTRIKK